MSFFFLEKNVRIPKHALKNVTKNLKLVKKTLKKRWGYRSEAPGGVQGGLDLASSCNFRAALNHFGSKLGPAWHANGIAYGLVCFRSGRFGFPCSSTRPSNGTAWGPGGFCPGRCSSSSSSGWLADRIALALNGVQPVRYGSNSSSRRLSKGMPSALEASRSPQGLPFQSTIHPKAVLSHRVCS